MSKNLPIGNTAGEFKQTNVLGQRAGVLLQTGEWRGQQVFVKSLQSEDPDIAARFHHEGEVATGLHHPMIIPLLGQTPSQLIFPFIAGGTLRDLARCGPMTPADAVAVTGGILAAVTYLHEQGVVHHDLKPENVMLRGGKPLAENIRLIDFGMSYAQHLPLDIHSGTRMGTPHFMAPEQFQGVRGDPRSDLYSVGVLMFDCLAGHPPYEDALGWLVGISENRAELPGPKALHPFMHSAIQRDMTKRPQSAKEMQERLQKASAELSLCSSGTQKVPAV